MAAIQPQFSPRQVALALQVSESSVKRWCDRGRIETVKTAGGHRRILLDSLLRFLESSRHTLVDPAALGLSGQPAVAGPLPQSGGLPDQLSFRELLACGDEPACRDQLQKRIAHLGSPTIAAEELLTDAMHCLGDAWEAKRLNVYQERRGCQICARLVWELRQGMRKPAGVAPIAIGGAPEGDPYQLATGMVELALREAGWAATSLGNDLPLDSLLQAAIEYQPRLLWISVSSVADEAQFVDRFNALAAALPSDVVLLVGGRALSDSLRPRLHYTAYCDTLRQLIELAGALRMLQERTAADEPGGTVRHIHS